MSWFLHPCQHSDFAEDCKLDAFQSEPDDGLLLLSKVDADLQILSWQNEQHPLAPVLEGTSSALLLKERIWCRIAMPSLHSNSYFPPSSLCYGLEALELWSFIRDYPANSNILGRIYCLEKVYEEEMKRNGRLYFVVCVIVKIVSDMQVRQRSAICLLLSDSHPSPNLHRFCPMISAHF